jgi:hypothetical protein
MSKWKELYDTHVIFAHKASGKRSIPGAAIPLSLKTYVKVYYCNIKPFKKTQIISL